MTSLDGPRLGKAERLSPSLRQNPTGKTRPKDSNGRRFGDALTVF